MRYSQDHRQQTRDKIVETAARQFREKGIHGIGIAGLMKSAGLTHGGFYNHFKSKEDLVTACLDKACADMRKQLADYVENGGIEALVEGYLSASHRDNPGNGCPFATLSADMNRRPGKVQTHIDALYHQHIDLLASIIAEQEIPDSVFTAQSLLARMMGCLQSARLIQDKISSDKFLERESGLILAWLTHKKFGRHHCKIACAPARQQP